MLDDGTGSLAVYAIYSNVNDAPLRILVYNSVLFDGSGVRPNTTVSFHGTGSGIPLPNVHLKRLTADSANSLDGVTIGGNYSFDGSCRGTGIQIMEIVPIEALDDNGTEALSISFNVTVGASEAVIVYI